MSKPVLLSGGNGKAKELAGTESRQVLTWSQTGEEWAPGPGVVGSGGGGELFYLNALTSPDSPVVNIPTGASGTTVKEFGRSANGTGSTVSSTASVPVLPNNPEIIAGFVTDLSVPDATEIPAGLWEFNVWVEATGNTTNQSFIQAKVYKYDGVNAPTAIATSASVFIYDPGEVTQYTLSVLIPGGVTLLATDRIYVEILGGSTRSNRQITLSFGNSTPSHVHTTLFIPINLGTDVTGTLPVANGGTGVAALPTGGVILVGTSGGIGQLAGAAVGDIPSWTASAGWGVTNRLAVANGGTFLTSYAVGDLLFATGTTTLARRAIGGTGTVLTSIGGVPQWAAPAAGGTVTSVSSSTTLSGLSLTTTNGTTTPAIALTGTLGVGSGGTGATTLTGYVKGAGTVTMTASATIPVADVTGAAPLASPVFTGTPLSTTAAVDTNTTQIATTAYVVGQGYLKSATASTTYAPLASPTFTGTPLSTTAAVDTNTTQIATTAYVVGQGYLKSATASTTYAPLASPTFTGTVTIPAGASISGFAPLASPTFTGTPSLPTGTTGLTQSAGNSTTALATTAFVTTAVATSSGAPYDVAGEYVGKPPVSTVLMRFIANRSWTLKRTLVQASCTTFPTGSNAVATISVAGANITSGTITWTTGSAVTIGSFADTTITSGQAVVLTVTTADSSNVFENPFFTLGGVVA